MGLLGVLGRLVPLVGRLLDRRLMMVVWTYSGRAVVPKR